MRTHDLDEIELESIRRVQYLIDTECDGRAYIFAEKTGVARASLSHYKHKLHAPAQDSAYLIAKAFDIDPMWVMGFDVPMKNPKINKTESDKIAETTLRLMKYKELLDALPYYFELSKKNQEIVVEIIYMMHKQGSVDGDTK